jgi:hypothetical protein
LRQSRSLAQSASHIPFDEQWAPLRHWASLEHEVAGLLPQLTMRPVVTAKTTIARRKFMRTS